MRLLCATAGHYFMPGEGWRVTGHQHAGHGSRTRKVAKERLDGIAGFPEDS